MRKINSILATAALLAGVCLAQTADYTIREVRDPVQLRDNLNADITTATGRIAVLEGSLGTNPTLAVVVGSLTTTGTVTAASIVGPVTGTATNLPVGTTIAAINGAAITNLAGGNIASGNIAEGRISNALETATAVGDAATVFTGLGTGLSAIDAADISAGTTISAINGAAITNLTDANVAGSWFTGAITNSSAICTNVTWYVTGRVSSNNVTGTP